MRTPNIVVFRIEASGELQINTTNSTRLGIAPRSFLLALSGEVAVFEVLRFNTELRVVVRNGGWRFDFVAEIDFFGILKIDGHGFVDSRGNFDITLEGHFVIGTEDFGLSGDATFRVWNITSSDSSGNPVYDFGLSISASLKAKLFGITLAGVGFNVTFAASSRDSDGGRVRIELSITVEVTILFITFSKTASFTVGYLQLPQPVFLAGDANGREDSPNWDPVDGGELFLNVGGRRGQRNIAHDCPDTNDAAEDECRDEPYIIRDGGFDDEGRPLILVTAFGRTNTFANVTGIRATFDDGTDQLFIDPSVTVPVSVDMGTGDDVVAYAGGERGERDRRRRGRRLPGVDRHLDERPADVARR